jgi:soluble lytic murein transglycosylase-like protein
MRAFNSFRICRLLLIVLLALQSVAPTVAWAAGPSDNLDAIKDRQAEVGREQAQVDLQIKLSSAKLVESQKKVNGLQVSLNNTIAKRKSTEGKIDESQRKLERSQAELSAAEDKLAATRKVFRKRLVGVYKSGRPDILQVILGSTSFNDLIGRLAYIRLVAEADARLMGEMKSLTETIANRISEIETTRKALSNQRQDLVAQEKSIKTITATIIDEQAALQEEVAEQQRLFSQMDEEKSRLAQAERELRTRIAIASTLPPGEMRELAVKFAEQYGIPVNIFLSLVTVESGWNPRAVSRAGALGLTQVMPFNVIAYGFGFEAFRASPALQLELGAKYLSLQYQTFGRWDLALAAYNAGPGAVLRGSDPAPPRDPELRAPDPRLKVYRFRHLPGVLIKCSLL